MNYDKRYVVAQAGIILSKLHAELAAHGLAMINLGSISDQTLAGVVTTATHGTGIDQPVLSMHVRALSLLLADGTRVRCSREENCDLFMASICGLGSTGLILDITLDVQPAFRLQEHQESRSFDDFLRNVRALVHADKFVRFWWFPQADVVRVSSFHETQEVRDIRSPDPAPPVPASLLTSFSAHLSYPASQAPRVMALALPRGISLPPTHPVPGTLPLYIQYLVWSDLGLANLGAHCRR